MPVVLLPKSLETLFVTFDSQRGIQIPEWMRRVPKVNLILDTAWMKYDLGDLATLTNVNMISLSSATPELEDQLLSGIAGCINLQHLIVNDDSPCNEPASDAGIMRIAKLSKLTSLRLGLGISSNADTTVLGNLSKMQELTLGTAENGMSTKWGFLTRLRNLRVLKIGLYGFQTGNNPEFIVDALQGLDQLEEVALTSGTLSDAGLMKFGNLKKLRVLDLSFTTGFSDDALANLMNQSPTLTTVKIAYPAGSKTEKK